MAREPFLSFREHECSSQPLIYTQGFNYDYINSHNVLLCCGHPSWDVHVPPCCVAFTSMLYITKTPRALLNNGIQSDYICSLTFLSGQRLHSSKTHTTPSRHKPATLNFQKKNKSHASLFSNNKSKCRCCCILPSLDLLTRGHRLDAWQGELLGTCHSTSGGCSHNTSGIWLSGASSQC